MSSSISAESSEKVAVTLVVRATPVALAVGTVLTTVGAVVSVGGGGGVVVPVSHSAFRQTAPEQSLRLSRRPCREDEVRGLGAGDFIFGGSGNDVIYGGPGRDSPLVGGEGDDVIYGGDRDDMSLVGDKGDDVIYGGDGDDVELNGDGGKDVIIGGDGSDSIYADGDRQRDKLYCGEGRDRYMAEKVDYVSSSCEVKMKPSNSKGIP